MKVTDLHPDIVLVSGKLCSGKGHYCKTQYPDHYHLPVSDVVKRLTNTNVRSQLADTATLDQQILQELSKEISQHPKIVIDGIRQFSILVGLQRRYGTDISDIIWLDVPDDVRRERFLARADKKDDASFDNASSGDIALGIDSVEHYIKHTGSTVFYS